jgi:hypothetical protein
VVADIRSYLTSGLPLGITSGSLLSLLFEHYLPREMMLSRIFVYE